MTSPNLVIRGRQVVLPESTGPASIYIAGDTIVQVTAYENIPENCEVVEAANGSVIMPGLVDTHVHINEPGRTHWEGFHSATRAAAAGGVTTLVDMPLNSIPPTTTLDGLEEKLAAARGKCFVDVGFWGGVVPGNVAEIVPLKTRGVVGFKCFLIHSGVDEFPDVTEDDLRNAMPVLSKLEALLIVHAEVPGPIEATGLPTCGDSGEATAYETFLASRPRAAEDEAVEMMIRLSREFGVRVHIVHHSSSNSLFQLQAAKAAGVKITAETCPHYLSIAAEDVPDGATEYKCCPPIRERDNNEQLWRALADGTIDFIVSDHSPCPPEMKLRDRGDFLQAWGGISSLQLRLPIIWTESRNRGFSLADVTRWLCSAPASLVGLERRKGQIANGFDADVVIWNPEGQFQVLGEKLHHRHKLTPYEGRTLRGVVEKTFLRGRKVYDGGELIGEPQGDLLL
jgi:allantoinase